MSYLSAEKLLGKQITHQYLSATQSSAIDYPQDTFHHQAGRICRPDTGILKNAENKGVPVGLFGIAENVEDCQNWHY